MMYSPIKVVPFLFCVIIVSLWASDLTTHAQPVVCKRNPVVFMFGDSNSDTGGYASAIEGLDIYPNGRAFSKPSGRASDGRLIIDFFCENLTASYLSAYMNSLEPNFKNGVNFAVGGATTKNNTYSLGVQINQMNRFHNLSLELQSKGYKDLHTQKDFQNALYLFDIGQNDITSAHGKNSVLVISTYVENIRNATRAIYNLGGRNFWIHNTGPIGCLPWVLMFKKVNGSDYDENGCIRPLNELAKEFNSQLYALCQQMRAELKNATIVFVDIYSIKYDLYARFDEYGFINPHKACCEICSKIGSDLCAEGSKYISWDGIHYTEAANSVVAAKILSQNFSEPPLPISFFCNTVE